MGQGYRIGMDIGGTFTDYVLIHDPSNGTWLHKRLTTPADPAQGALAGLEELLALAGCSWSDVDVLVHGTTLITNALITRQGARTALLTTAGFRDILDMGYEQRYDIYDLFLPFPKPLIPRRLRIEVGERMTRDGVALQAPDLNWVADQVGVLSSAGIEAIAICLLHAYRNPAHEQAIADCIRQRYPQLALSLSSEVVPEIREYERTVTTAANAFVQPLIHRYLGRIEQALAAAGFTGQFLLMQSSGGLIAPAVARRFPIRLLESGPVGGALLTAYLGQAIGQRDLVAFDMGGTTAKACLIQKGHPTIAPAMEVAREQRFKPGSGLPIKTPTVDLIEIGAGGGSIARIDALGLLKVGPQSAGANPGPACYGKGGVQPTVSDACVVLGYLDAQGLLGGALPLDVAAAQQAIATLAGQLGLSISATAWGIYEIVCELMATAARTHIIERGGDPRHYPLMAFGGAGPLHAVRVARRLGATEVIVPPAAGAAAALGFLSAPISVSLSRSYPGEVRQLDWPTINALFGELEREAAAFLTAAQVPPQSISFERQAKMRLAGQFHDLAVRVPQGRLDAAAGEQLVATFTAAYQQRFHTILPEYTPLVLHWGLHATSLPPATPLLQPRLALRSGDASQAWKGHRQAFSPAAADYQALAVYTRTLLKPGDTLQGPAIIEERESTTVIEYGDLLTVDTVGNLRICIGGAR